MSSAVAGLVGVVIGGVLSGGVQIAVARWQERRVARATARLAILDLFEQIARLIAALNTEKWEPLTRVDLDHWREQRVVLAHTLRGRDWAAVQSAYMALTLVTRHVEFAPADASPQLPASVKRDTKLALRQVERASEALSRYTGMPKPTEEDDDADLAELDKWLADDDESKG